ncbi:MAG: polysaccharide biosynthesis C-terminal domain-containing protein, partial [Rhodospirillales bacterium]|nr:polysaccharide biosynthesis C-terminal domain-containing protein [Rhodospirillales bacterium]
VGLLAPTLVVIGFAEPLLRLWLGASFAAQASGVLRLLGAGVLFMCADTVPAGLLDGIGRPDLNAKLAVASLLLYVPALFALIHGFGIAGAALAWAGRVIATYAARLLIAWHSYRPLSAEMLRLLPPLVVALFAVLTMLAARALAPQAVVLAGCLAVFGAVVWLVALTAEERAYVQARIRRRR